MKPFRAVVGLAALVALSPASLSLAVDAGSAGAVSIACESSDRCSIELPDSTGAPVTQPREVATAGKLSFLWGVGCSHCERAKPFIERMREERPDPDLGPSRASTPGSVRCCLGAVLR